MIRVIVLRELRSLYTSTTSWLVLAAASAIMSWLFFTRLENYQKIQPTLSAAATGLGITDLVVAPTVSNAIMLYLLLIPLLGMASISDERRSGRISLWYSSPISTSQILFGKYLGILIGSLPLLLLPLVMGLSLEFGTSLDPGRMASTLVALLLAGVLTSSMTLWASSLGRHPLIAAILASGLLFFFWLITTNEDGSIFNWFAMAPRINHLLLGLIATQDLAYFVILSTGLLALTWQRLWKDTHSTGRHWWRHPVFQLLLLCLMLETGYLSQQYSFSWDLTGNHKNSLSQSSINLLSALKSPIRITAFAPELPVIQSPIRELIARYQRIKPNISLTFIDPAIHPDQARRHNIKQTGELLIEIQGKSGKVLKLSESAISSTIARLVLRGERWVTAIRGHGEPSMDQGGQQSLTIFASRLHQAGYRHIQISLSENASIPRNTSVLLLAGPQQALEPSEISKIKGYLDGGGNLLWLMETDQQKQLADLLGIQVLPGIIVDAAATDLGLKSPVAAIATSYPDHPALRNLDQGSAFIGARALQANSTLPNGWAASTLLTSSPRSWNETGPLEGAIKLDTGQETRGPLAIGLALSRKTADDSDQHLVVISDVDFLTNSNIGHGANASLGLGLIHWLSGNTQMVSVRQTPMPDVHLNWSTTTATLVSLSLMIGLPLFLVAMGIGIRLWRQRR